MDNSIRVVPLQTEQPMAEDPGLKGGRSGFDMNPRIGAIEPPTTPSGGGWFQISASDFPRQLRSDLAA
jgi:hypothetical protein